MVQYSIRNHKRASVDVDFRVFIVNLVHFYQFYQIITLLHIRYVLIVQFICIG
jgi:hypothetical protein